ncbi:MAG: serine hydrolase [Kiritimatiellae bacterium]|nr:serine hydrolase [Kiritimatiellia bacterium]
MMATKTFPKADWEVVDPAEVGVDARKLNKAKEWLDANMSGAKYRVAVVREGYVIAQWRQGMGPDDKAHIASAAKSIYSNILGIAVAEGKLPSADAKVVDYYPEMMDVPEDGGPKPGRYAFEKDRAMTFRQLICNTSGYMKPDEEPGRVFHYQTYGMNILTHALAKIYGLFDVNDPEGSPGFKVLIDEKLAGPIGAQWVYKLNNFKLWPQARLPIFGYYCSVGTDPLDFARIGWLWCNDGRWEETQVIPEAWMRESVRVAPDIRANCPEDQWKYGHGIWSNEAGRLWPDLPADGFSACGAGGHFCSVFPSQGVVIVQNPGRYLTDEQARGQDRANGGLLQLVLDACR